MSENGMSYEKKGSGAIIRAGEIVIKASSVSRNLSLTKLEKRFGPFQEEQDKTLPTPEAACKVSAHQPLGKSNDNANWRAYIAERNEFYNAGKFKRKHQGMTQKQERQELKKRQCEERRTLFTDCRKQHFTRTFTNQKRAVLSTKHAYETAVLKALHKKQRDELKKQTAKYLSFESWLRVQNLSSQADEWRHRKDKNFIRFDCPCDTIINAAYAEPVGILGFTMTQTRQGARFYNDKTPERASFIDMGRYIRVYDTDEDSILAALQLAQAKWSGVQVNGGIQTPLRGNRNKERYSHRQS
jgi:hypothetical protein